MITRAGRDAIAVGDDMTACDRSAPKIARASAAAKAAPAKTTAPGRRLKNDEFKDCDHYTGTGAGPCHNYLPEQWITSMRWPSPLRKDAQ